MNHLPRGIRLLLCLGSVNSASMNTAVRETFHITEFSSLLDIYPGVGLVESHRSSVFEVTSMLFSTETALIYISSGRFCFSRFGVGHRNLYILNITSDDIEPQLWAPCITRQIPTGYPFHIW